MSRATALLAFVLLSVCSSAAAAGTSDIQLHVISQPTWEVIDTLSFMSGIPVTTSGTISGRIENLTLSGDPLKAFSTVGKASNLFVAFDGTRVILAPKNDLSTTVLSAKGKAWKSAQQAISALYPILPDDAVQYQPESDMVIVRGPSNLVAAVEAVLSQSRSVRVQILRGGKSETVVLDDEGT